MEDRRRSIYEIMEHFIIAGLPDYYKTCYKSVLSGSFLSLTGLT